MPFPRSHLYITWFGDAWTTQEEWQFGLRVDRATQPTIPEVTSLAAAGTGFITDPAFQISNKVRYLGCKAALLDTQGRYANGGDAVEYQLPSPVGGISSDAAYPQISLAVSTRSDRNRGYASKGRFYPPVTCQAPGPSGRIGQGIAATAATVAAAFVAEVNEIMGAPVSIFSSVGAGAVEPVTRIRVGQVVDTQRRRREQISEEWEEAPLPQ
jgi:hypothetical protein